MRISDWSSDVCSSDLGGAIHHPIPPPARTVRGPARRRGRRLRRGGNAFRPRPLNGWSRPDGTASAPLQRPRRVLPGQDRPQACSPDPGPPPRLRRAAPTPPSARGPELVTPPGPPTHPPFFFFINR